MMVRDNDIGDNYLVIRLWQSDFTLGDRQQSLWIGNVAQLESRNLINLVTVLRTDLDFDQPLRRFLADFRQYTKRNINIPGTFKEGIHYPATWDGSIILLETPAEDSNRILN